MVSSSALVSFSAVLRDVAIVARHEIPLPESFSTVFAFPVRKVCCFVAHSFCESGASGTLLVWNWLRSSDELFEVDIDSGIAIAPRWVFGTTVRAFDTRPICVLFRNYQTPKRDESSWLVRLVPLWFRVQTILCHECSP
jgi:hypothetical protein